MSKGKTYTDAELRADLIETLRGANMLRIDNDDGTESMIYNDALETIITAVKVLDRLQGEPSEEMEKIGRETLLAYGNGTREMFKSMAAKLIEEAQNDN